MGILKEWAAKAHSVISSIRPSGLPISTIKPEGIIFNGLSVKYPFLQAVSGFSTDDDFDCFESTPDQESTKDRKELFKDFNTETLLTNFVDTVRKFLNGIDCNYSFFIAGGSVASLLNNTYKFNDVDVYFYDSIDAEIVYKAIKKHPEIGQYSYQTDNAISIRLGRFDLDFQFIKRTSGDPWSVFNTFDLNASKVCYTSRMKIITDPGYSFDLRVDFSNFNFATLNRYIKYIQTKNYNDENNGELHSIFNFILDHKDEMVRYGYTTDRVPIMHALSNFLAHREFEPWIGGYIHDQIVKRFDEDTRLELFKELKNISIPEELSCDELILQKVIDRKPTYSIISNPFVTEAEYVKQPIVYSEREKEVMLKYSEYFI